MKAYEYTTIWVEFERETRYAPRRAVVMGEDAVAKGQQPYPVDIRVSVAVWPRWPDLEYMRPLNRLPKRKVRSE